MTGQRPARSDPYPWYDSYWLAEYVRYQSILERTEPQTLRRFIDALRIFETPADFRVKLVERPFDDDDIAAIRRIVAAIAPQDLELHEGELFGRFVVHHHRDFAELHDRAVPLVSDLVGEEVEPSYNFLSFYSSKGTCPPHLDAPIAKWTLDFCIDQSAPWPFHIGEVQRWPISGTEWAADEWMNAIRRSVRFRPYTLQPGQAVVFSGSSQWHYRDAMPNGGGRQYCDLLFFHFIPKGSAELVWPENWTRLFGVPTSNTRQER
jgi:hypothetical protein